MTKLLNLALELLYKMTRRKNKLYTHWMQCSLIYAIHLICHLFCEVAYFFEVFMVSWDR